jgi:hypothetical protein
MRGLTLCSLAIAGLALTGCIQPPVMAKTPLFTSADSVGAPPLREGWWIPDDGSCRFATEEPMKRWPDCAKDRSLVQGSTFASYNRDGWEISPVTLVSGDPLLMQLRDKDSDEKIRYEFLVLRRLTRDAEGRLISFEAGLLPCGPFRSWTPDIKAEADRQRWLDDPKTQATIEDRNPRWPNVGTLKTWKLYQGFHWDKDDDEVCWAEAPRDIRNAAPRFYDWVGETQQAIDKAIANPDGYDAERKLAGYSRRKARKFVDSEKVGLSWYHAPYRWVREARPDDFTKP